MGEIAFPYATVEDLKAVWADFPAGAESFAQKKLEYASQLILDNFQGREIRVGAKTLERITVAMVMRAMGAESQNMPLGAESYQMGAGPYQGTARYGEGIAELYLKKRERQELGLVEQEAFSIDLLGNRDV